jgi:hypothetical protein
MLVKVGHNITTVNGGVVAQNMGLQCLQWPDAAGPPIHSWPNTFLERVDWWMHIAQRLRGRGYL